MSQRVIVVHLRRPRLNDPNDSRKDPFWEFGSFGLTGCHSRNIMHSKNADGMNGVRLAFIQGGYGQMRLVYLTPPIKMIVHKNVVEACWVPSMPFDFYAAPVVVNNFGKSNFPKLKGTFSAVRRDTWVRKCSSMYRSKKGLLPEAAAKEVVYVFDTAYADRDGKLAIAYEKALPFDPALVDRGRRKTYRKLLSQAKF